MQAQQDIINYYDHCECDYRFVWRLNKYLSMHYGYWDESTLHLRDALKNINKKLAERACIKKSDTVLDAGCGVGGSSIFLSKNIGCRVTGITLSEKQASTAARNAAFNGVSDLARFQRMDYTSTAFEPSSFDVVWAIESVCYAPDKLDFLKEAYRVLRKNGRVVLADFFSTHIDNHKLPLYRKFADGWAVNDFAEIRQFEQQAHDAGFTNIEVTDITFNVMPSAKRLFYAFLPGVVLHYPMEALGLRNELTRKNMWTAYYQYAALKKGLWRYYIVSSIKP